MQITKIGVVTNLWRSNAAQVLEQLGRKATEMGFTLLVEPDAQSHIPESVALKSWDLAEEADALLALGGDGTVLRAVGVLGGRDLPILGINLGKLGFLTSLGDDAIEEALKMLASGDYNISQRALAECKLFDGQKQIGCYHALNDVVIAWGAASHIVRLNLAVGGDRVAEFMCDGIIVSTPTGSTGHSLSAGGPILHPGTPAFVINVICPHSLSARPLVVTNDHEIEIEVERVRKKLICSVDGQDVCEEVKDGYRAVISKSSRQASFIRVPDHSYYEVLRKKLHWRGSSV